MMALIGLCFEDVGKDCCMAVAVGQPEIGWTSRATATAPLRVSIVPLHPSISASMARRFVEKIEGQKVEKWT